VHLEPALIGRLARDVDHHAQCAGGPFDQPAGEAPVGERGRIGEDK
jgi:hypothetical protein